MTMNGLNGTKNGLQIKWTGREKKKHQREQRDTQLTNLKLKTSEKNQPTRFEMKKAQQVDDKQRGGCLNSNTHYWTYCLTKRCNKNSPLRKKIMHRDWGTHLLYVYINVLHTMTPPIIELWGSSTLKSTFMFSHPSPKANCEKVSQMRSSFIMKDIDQATISTFHETSLICLHPSTWIS